jgi:hypothetical protein
LATVSLKEELPPSSPILSRWSSLPPPLPSSLPPSLPPLHTSTRHFFPPSSFLYANKLTSTPSFPCLLHPRHSSWLPYSCCSRWCSC